MTTQESKCLIEGCKKPYRAKGYCNIHYKKWRSGELPKPRYKTCLQEGCRKKRYESSSLCEEHLKAKLGKPEAPAAPAKTETDVPEKTETVQATPEAPKPAVEQTATPSA